MRFSFQKSDIFGGKPLKSDYGHRKRHIAYGEETCVERDGYDNISRESVEEMLESKNTNWNFLTRSRCSEYLTENSEFQIFG